MGYTLYGSQGSGSAAIEAALVRCGQPWREVRASSWEPDSAQAQLQAANPIGQIPTLLTPQGDVLTESAAILIHLGLVHPGARLLPAGPAERAQVLRALVYVAANCYAAIGVIDYPQRWCEPGRGGAAGDEATFERIRKGTRRRLHALWDAYADSFERLPFDPDAPDAADLLSAVVSRWSGARAHIAKTRPALAERWRAVEAHAQLAPVFARHWPG